MTVFIERRARSSSWCNFCEWIKLFLLCVSAVGIISLWFILPVSLHANAGIDDIFVGYLSGRWVSAANVSLHMDLISDPKLFELEDEPYTVERVADIDGTMGIVKINLINPRGIQEQVQINRVFGVPGVVVATFEESSTTCQAIRSRSHDFPEVKTCTRAFHWQPIP